MDISDIKEIKGLIEEKGRGFEEFKKANDARLEALEKGRGTGDHDAKLGAVNDALTELRKQVEALETKGSRPGAVGATDKAYSEGFQKFVRKGDASAIETKAVNTESDADGGYAVPEELDRTILQLLGDETPMRAVCGHITVGTDGYKKLVNVGGAGSGWVGETDERPETATPKLAEIGAYMGEIYAQPAATQKSLDDLFFNVEQWLADEVLTEFSEQENKAFVHGDGIKKPKGFLAYKAVATRDAERAVDALQFVPSGAAGRMTTDGLVDLVQTLRRGYRKNASWMLNGLSVGEVRKLKDAEGNYLWQPGLQQGQPDRLLGYGIVENDDMPDIAADSIPIAFGDWKRGYLVVDRIGTRMLRDPYTRKPFVLFYTTKRVGGMLNDHRAIKLLKIGA